MTIQRIVQMTPDFDSELGNSADEDNATPLTVILRIAFRAAEPLGGTETRPTSCGIQTASRKVSIGSDWAEDLNGRVFRIVNWPSGALTTFAAQFRSQVENLWNNRFFLKFPNPNDPAQAMNQADFDALQAPALIGRKTPFLRCLLRIDAVAEAERHHALMHVINLASGPSCKFQTFVAQRPGQADVGFLTNRDSTRTSAHETGHMLGLQHVNDGAPACQSNHDADICYGETPLQRRDLMGEGTAVHGAHARRWLEAVALHTGHAAGWSATHIEPPIEELLESAVRRP